jgi:hypothetical protein
VIVRILGFGCWCCFMVLRGRAVKYGLNTRMHDF